MSLGTAVSKVAGTGLAKVTKAAGKAGEKISSFSTTTGGKIAKVGVGVGAGTAAAGAGVALAGNMAAGAIENFNEKSGMGAVINLVTGGNADDDERKKGLGTLALIAIVVGIALLLVKVIIPAAKKGAK